MADQIQNYIKEAMPVWKKQYRGIEELKVAVMGCVVNGPGESKHANVGISLPGAGEDPKSPVYIDGKRFTILQGPNVVSDFKAILNEYIASHYGINPD
jgi:(E)-4-hydroxy-3-methylbut-2-enyl-diphosphate synthase